MEPYYGELLVQLARKAVELYVKSGKKLKPKDMPGEFIEKRGVFVTLHTYPDKELRGCIGYPEPVMPLIDALVEAAVTATMDPRFAPLSKEELGHVIVEVSVLTSPELIQVRDPKEYLSRIDLGKDGLIIEKGHCRGLLLPQVAIEWKWDKETFLGNLCVKANMSPDQWHAKGVKIYKFQADIFTEEMPLGRVKKVMAGASPVL